MNDADLLNTDWRQAAEWEVDDLATACRRVVADPARRRVGPDVDHQLVDAVVDRSHQQHLRFGPRHPVVGILPHVVKPAGWVGQHEPTVGCPHDARSDHLLERIGGVEGHVRLLLVLPEPAHQIWERGAVAILFEGHHNRPRGADIASLLAHPDASLVVPQQGFAEVDSIEHAGGEGLGPGSLSTQYRHRPLLEVVAPILDNDVFGRIGTDAVALECLQPLARLLGGRPCPHGYGDWSLFDPHESSPEPDGPCAEVEELAVDSCSGDFGRLLLPRVATRGVEDLPGKIVVADTTRTHHPLVEAADQVPPNSRVSVNEIEEQSPLPWWGFVARLLCIGGGADFPYHVAESRSVTDPPAVGGFAAAAVGREGRQCPSSLGPVFNPATADHRQYPVRQLEPGCNCRPKLGQCRWVSRTQVLVDGVCQRWVGQNGGQAFRVEVTEIDLGSPLASKRRRRRAFEILNDSIGVSGADQAQDRAVDGLGRLQQMMCDALLAHCIALVVRGRAGELADQLDIALRADLV